MRVFIATTSDGLAPAYARQAVGDVGVAAHPGEPGFEVAFDGIFCPGIALLLQCLPGALGHEAQRVAGEIQQGFAFGIGREGEFGAERGQIICLVELPGCAQTVMFDGEINLCHVRVSLQLVTFVTILYFNESSGRIFMATVISPRVADVAEASEVYEYMNGFGNEFESEALAGALPQGRFSPQKVAYGLYAEKLSSTAFTAPRETNRRTWFYRIRPSVTHGEFHPVEQLRIVNGPIIDVATPPNQMRWNPIPIPDTPC